MILLYRRYEWTDERPLQPDHAFAADYSSVGLILTLCACPNVSTGVVQAPMVAMVNYSPPASEPKDETVH
jgi:hypothetical protein